MSILMKLMGADSATKAGAKECCRECLCEYADAMDYAGAMVAMYKHAIDIFASSITGLPPNAQKEIRDRLKKHRDEFGPLLPKPVLASLRKNFDDIMKSYSDKVQRQIKVNEQQTRESMASLAVMAEVIAAREETYKVRFNGIAKKVRALASEPDMGVIQQRLEAELQQLEQYAHEEEQDRRVFVNRVADSAKKKGGPEAA